MYAVISTISQTVYHTTDSYNKAVSWKTLAEEQTTFKFSIKYIDPIDLEY